jgi:hypothetical protein
MRISKDIGIYDVENPSDRENIFPELGNSQIIEPDIIIPIDVSNPVNTNNTSTDSTSGSTTSGSTSGSTNSGSTSGSTNSGSTSGSTTSGSTSGSTNSGSTSSSTTSGSTSNNTSEPSATTDETKTYVEGGTTPDSNIVIKKPMTKYYIYGIVGIIGALIAYKVFFSKKTP